MSKDANIARQADEIEALTAIYGDEWCVIDSSSNIYCILVSDNTEAPKWKLSLQVHLPHDYPLLSPPEYQINTSSGTQKVEEKRGRPRETLKRTLLREASLVGITSFDEVEKLTENGKSWQTTIAPWLRGEERVNLDNKLSQVYCNNMGEDLIFLWVEAVREFLQEKSDRDLQVHGHAVVQSAEAEDNEDEFDPSILGDLSYFPVEQSRYLPQSVPCPEIFHGDTLTDRRSTFQAHLAHVTDKAQIPAVLNELLENKKIANATHNMFAYRIMSDSGLVYQGCDDDGETHAGSRMLHLLQIMNVENVIVVVSRWYGGILLGSDRFKHINNCTRQILEANGFHRDKDEKRGPKSGKKTR